MTTQECLQQTLLNLSQAQNVQFENVTAQIRETRTALLLSDGVDLSKMDDINERLAMLEKIESSIATKTELLANYNVLIAEARARLKTISEQVEKQEKK